MLARRRLRRGGGACRCQRPLLHAAVRRRLSQASLSGGRGPRTGAQIIVPTGALIGLDTVRAMAIGEIHSVTLETRKPPDGLSGAPHLIANNISVDNLSEPLLVFEGHAGEAAEAFPANVNVAAALALAGVGPERTQVKGPGPIRMWAATARPSPSRPTRARRPMTINNLPSVENRRRAASSPTASSPHFSA